MHYEVINKRYLAQFYAIITGTLFAVSDGMAFAWTAPFIPYLTSKESHIRTTEDEAGWLESAFLCGGLCALPLTIYSVNNLGRKNSLLIAATTIVIAWTLTGLGNKMWYLFVARFLFGSAENMALVAAPMYASEIADQKIRGCLLSIIFAMIHLGVFLVYTLGALTSFFVVPVVGVIIGLVELTLFSSVPETPYYLLSKNKPEEARKSLGYFKPYVDVTKEMGEISETLEKQMTNQGRLKDLFVIRSNRKAMMIMFALSTGHHMTAYTAIMMNIHSIIEAAGTVYMESSRAAMLFAALMLVAIVVCAAVVDRYGRRLLLLISGSATGFCVLTLAVFFHLQFLDYDVTDISWVPLAAVMVYAVFFKLGIGSVSVIMTAEIFPIDVKALGIISGDLVYLVTGICSLQIFQRLTGTIFISFYIFALWSFCSVLFTFFFIPETKGRTLDEIQTILKGGWKHNRKSGMVN